MFKNNCKDSYSYCCAIEFYVKNGRLSDQEKLNEKKIKRKRESDHSGLSVTE